MALSIDAISQSGDTTGAPSSISWSHTCASGSVLYVSVMSGNAVAVSSVTYNGVSLTQYAKAVSGNAGNSEIWGIDTPSSGAHTILVTMASAARPTGGGISFTGAAATSLGATNTIAVSPGVGASISISLTTTVANSIIFDSYFQNGNAAQTNSATGTGHTRQYQNYNITDGELGAGGTTTTSTVTSYTLGYTSTPSQVQTLAVAEVKPATAPTSNGNFLQFM